MQQSSSSPISVSVYYNRWIGLKNSGADLIAPQPIFSIGKFPTSSRDLDDGKNRSSRDRTMQLTLIKFKISIQGKRTSIVRVTNCR